MGVVPSLLTGFARDSHSNRLTKAMRHPPPACMTSRSIYLMRSGIADCQSYLAFVIEVVGTLGLNR